MGVMGRFLWALECNFVQSTERKSSGLLDWGNVPNRRGGFLGLWWFPCNRRSKYTLYFQLEVVPSGPARQKLCLRVEAGEDNRAAADYHELVRVAAEKEGVSVERPHHMRTGATMTVAWWPGEWLIFSADGHPDVLQTTGILRRARRILQLALTMDASP